MAQIQPNCFECKYHFITHQPKRPYGCRRFGFKGPFLPSRMVFQETGMKSDKARGPTGSNGRLA